MKAIVYRKNGSPDVLTCEELDKPVPGRREVLVKVMAAAVNPLDYHMLKGGPAFLRFLLGSQKLKHPGVDFAGVVEATGPEVAQIRAGDAVFGTCRGAFAEYAIASESSLAPKPANVGFADAAALPVAGLTALQALRDRGNVRTGQAVLINGASGGVGTFAVQLARIFGAHVTAVCSARNADMVRALGADRVIDYSRQDFAEGSERYDLIVDLAGNHSFASCTRVLNARGIHVGLGILDGPTSLVVLSLGLLAALVRSFFSTRKFVTFIARANRQDLTFLGQLVAGGKLKPVIEKTFTLEHIADALRQQGTWHTRGKLVVEVAQQANQTADPAHVAEHV